MKKASPRLSFVLSLTIVVFGFCGVSVSAHAQSIMDLPMISKLIVHHYECRVAIIPASGDAKEQLFQIDPNTAGHNSSEVTITLGADTVVASANVQMLEINWTRNGQPVADAQAWVQNSTTLSHVIIVTDPKDESAQADMNCNAITYANLKDGAK